MKTIPLKNSKLLTKVSDEWFNALSKQEWRLDPNGYVVTADHARTKMHAFLVSYDTRTEEVHHKDHDPLNNQIDNLQVLSFLRHLSTRPAQTNNKCGYKGVSWKKGYKGRRDAWCAQINIDGKKKFLGRFDTAEQAARAYDEAVKMSFGETAFLNNV